MFGARRRGGDDAHAPRGLASLVAALQSQRGADAAPQLTCGGRPGFAASRLSHQHGFASLGLAPATAAATAENGDDSADEAASFCGGGGRPHSHAISPAAATYQPASPQT